MWSVVGLTLLLMFALASACDAQEVYPGLQRDLLEKEPHDGLPHEYMIHVNRGRTYARQRQWEQAEREFRLAKDVVIHESASYDVWLELSEAQCHLGKTETALKLLDDFGVALTLDYGSENCYLPRPKPNILPPNPKLSNRVFNALCSEDVESSRHVFDDDSQKKSNEAIRKKRHTESAVLRRHCVALGNRQNATP